ncbi:MAG: type II 3-dehydroquinate dehydratase [Chitinophagaceae bacterium]|nr:type II 3-dehydroquinate dehydratase [Chitinophagaceae bacterium]
MRKTIHIINGPNLNLLGLREPGLYGHQSMEAYLAELRQANPEIDIHYFQSNIEGELIGAIQALHQKTHGLIINAGAYSHTSIGMADAIRAVDIPKVIEVHISNVYAREDYRKHSYIASVCNGSITGLGLQGYALALQALLV